MVDFYNTRDVDDKWADPELAENINTDELGDLGLTDEEVDAIVAFMRTLTDGYQLYDKPVFLAKKAIIEIPYVRVEGVNQFDRFYSVNLQQTNIAGVYEIQQLIEILITDYSMVESMAYYSLDTGLLELPELLAVNSTNKMKRYTSQLKKMSKETGELVFELLFIKRLQ